MELDYVARGITMTLGTDTSGRIAPGCKADLLAWGPGSLFKGPLRGRLGRPRR
jgi:cytosine/adenosine deaminase-related metal-dependent hydrolase